MRLSGTTVFRLIPCYLGVSFGWHGVSWLGLIWEWPTRDWRQVFYDRNSD